MAVIEKERTTAPFVPRDVTDLDGLDTIDTEKRCHVLKACEARAALCGEAVNPRIECHIGCSSCFGGHESLEACPRCGRLVCEKCKREFEGDE